MAVALDLYCERIGPGLFAEPVNALSNGAFLLAAAVIASMARARQRLDGGLRLLVALVAAIGVGSALFHTLANGWALLADLLPILLFQLVFLALYLRRNVGAGGGATALSVGAFLVAGQFCRRFPQLLNGSLAYLPALALLLLLGWHHRRTSRREPLLLLGAAGVFAASLAFRTLDPLVCPVLPVGTHFLWHGLNAVVLVLTARSLLLPPLPVPPTAAGQTGEQPLRP
jgi:hypothetical protein